ncbi:DUF1622 domain-containing protein [Streptomyces brasiliscabiei]|uniref:DUF1622 domain-containing protein n=1 Tax=Streptomyces brasiliscabiei TaxID=2736302 RepID=UPI001C116C32|nr:DUF1622 domain-containing protein [Streptomyces brasiliscabiei]
MTGALHQAASLVTLLGLVSAVRVGLRLRRVQPTVALLSDFLLAAGLIRLAAEPSWRSLATAAATAAVRMLLNAGLRASASHR